MWSRATQALTLGAMLVACGGEDRAARAPRPRAVAPSPAPVAPSAEADACPPLTIAQDPAPSEDDRRARAEAIVSAADRFLRDLEPRACPRSVRSMHVESSSAWLGIVLERDGDPREIPLTAQLGCDWRSSPCGSRPSDWTIDSDDAWLATRRVDRGAAWLAAHPEIVLVSQRYLGLGTWMRRRVLRTSDTVICVSNEGAMEPVCWADPRPARHLWSWGFEWPRLPRPNEEGDEHDYDRVGGLIALGPFGGQMDVWAVRFPEAEWVALPPQPIPEAGDEHRPLWFPSRAPRLRFPTARLPSGGWQPMTRIGAPDLGALEGLSTVVIGAASDELSAMDLVTDAALASCVRREGRWACAPTVAVEPFAFHSDSHAHVYTVPSATGRAWIALTRTTWEDGGNGEGSGAGGDDFLELYRDEGERLVPVASIRLGHMSWETVRLRGGYSRSVRRYFHRHAPAGTDCLRIDAPIAHAGWADGQFVTSHPTGGPPRARLRPEAAPETVPFAAFPTSHGVGGESGENVLPEHADFFDFEGVWRIEADRLVRVSRDVRARCDRPAPE